MMAITEKFVIEVDKIKLFDAVRLYGADAIGTRLVMLCLDGGETSFKNALGLAVYGISFGDHQ